MANRTNPNDPYRADPVNRGIAAENDLRRASLRENDLRSDPDLADSSTSGSRMALYAVGIALVLGALFYGFSGSNTSNTNQAGNTPASQSAQTQPGSPPAASPGMRDVTPRTTDSLNNNPGTTTGAAPVRPTPPAAPEANRPTQPPAATNGTAPPQR
jgi:hypothetical protein